MMAKCVATSSETLAKVMFGRAGVAQADVWDGVEVGRVLGSGEGRDVRDSFLFRSIQS